MIMQVLMTQAAIEVTFIAIGVALGSAVVSKLITNPKRMKEIKDRMNGMQKRMAEARKKNDETEIKRLAEEQKQMMPLMKEMMIGSFKPMLITFIPLLLVLWFMGSAYGKEGVIIDVPFIGLQSWIGWDIIIALITGLLFELIFKKYMERNGKKNLETKESNTNDVKKEPQQQPAENNPKND